MSENVEVNPAGESPQPPAEDKSANDRIRLLEAKNAELIVNWRVLNFVASVHPSSHKIFLDLKK